VALDIVSFPTRRSSDLGLEEWWCLGSQYWSRNKHTSNYNAYYGILLDMVGARSAQFHREGYSMEFASGIVEKVWNHAQRLGFSRSEEHTSELQSRENLV